MTERLLRAPFGYGLMSDAPSRTDRLVVAFVTGPLLLACISAATLLSLPSVSSPWRYLRLVTNVLATLLTPLILRAWVAVRVTGRDLASRVIGSVIGMLDRCVGRPCVVVR